MRNWGGWIRGSCGPGLEELTLLKLASTEHSLLYLPPPLWFCLLQISLSDSALLGWVLCSHHPQTCQVHWHLRAFTFTFCLEPQIITRLTLASFKSLLQYHFSKRALPPRVIIWPMLADLLLFLLFLSVYPCLTCCMFASWLSSPSPECQGKDQNFSVLLPAVPLALRLCVYGTKGWLDSLGLISHIMAQDVFSRVSV